jgi:hypothetical protein
VSINGREEEIREKEARQEGQEVNPDLDIF